MPGSSEAWKKLSQLVYGKAVKCTQVGRNAGTVCDGRSPPTSRDRIVAQCYVDGHDIAAILVLDGVACDWPKFSGGYYKRLAEGNACTRK
jgi:endonuclease YncB( thermonuclease family)